MEKNRGFCDGFYLTIIDLICMIKVHKVLEMLVLGSGSRMISVTIFLLRNLIHMNLEKLRLSPNLKEEK